MDALTFRLESCCTLQIGVLLRRGNFDEYGETRVVQIRDIDAKGNLVPQLDRIRFASGINKEKFLRDNDVLLKGRGSRIVAAHIKAPPAKTVVSSAYFILRAKPNVLPGFLAWHLNNARLPMVRSMTMSLLHLKDLREMPIRLPGIDVQQQIVETHDLIEKGRRLSERYYLRAGRLLRGVVFNPPTNAAESRQASMI